MELMPASNDRTSYPLRKLESTAKPLILAARTDLHAAAVSWGLKMSGVVPIWAPSFADDSIGSLTLRASKFENIQISGPHYPAPTVVWLRRPRKPTTFLVKRSADRKCLEREWADFHDNLFALSETSTRTLWINRPSAAARTENKLVQLQTASECGLDIPDTLVSNDPNAVREFIAKQGKVVYKTFSPHLWHNSKTNRSYVLWVRLLDQQTELDDISIGLCPSIYQAFVNKRSDIRITIIGDRFFGLRIKPINAKRLVDWRAHGVSWHDTNVPREIRGEVIQLPPALEAKVRALMRRLGIVFGCADFVEDNKGQYHFLEINQGGEFLFTEELCAGLPVLRAMCAMLAVARSDYSMEDYPHISYDQFKRSRDFADCRLATEQFAAESRALIE